MADISLERPPVVLRYDDGSTSFVLRPARAADAELLVEGLDVSLPELRRFMPWALVDQTVEMQRERLAALEVSYVNGGDYGFHLMDAGEKEIWGSLGLHRRTLNPKALDLGYWIRSDRAGRGLATCASQCLVILCLGHFGLERLQSGYNEANVASARVQRKIGFREEARLRYFQQIPTPADRAVGLALEPFTVITALFGDDRPRLDWWSDISANLEVVATRF
jgi:ribosomal-protein-serine acetyltransferase